MIGEINSNIKVIRNDEMNISEINHLDPDYIIISPGPGKPIDGGISIDVIKEFHENVPILGVCLGHQCIYQAFGGEVSYSKKLIHGKASNIEINNKSPLFDNLNNKITVGRYHSLSGTKNSLPKDISIIAESKDDNEIMAISHDKYPVYGLQFHPESILSSDGLDILKNFLNRC